MRPGVWPHPRISSPLQATRPQFPDLFPSEIRMLRYQIPLRFSICLRDWLSEQTSTEKGTRRNCGRWRQQETWIPKSGLEPVSHSFIHSINKGWLGILVCQASCWAWGLSGWIRCLPAPRDSCSGSLLQVGSHMQYDLDASPLNPALSTTAQDSKQHSCPSKGDQLNQP